MNLDYWIFMIKHKVNHWSGFSILLWK